ncbi:hypothetical protein X474_00030 [Dethiosulfatarculus sandiegensis]|uniref:Uncharacterized protein n=1 Tax=Dethiosulfatarculus sandiegensis TaxID=1429043 RepID=A0A0D2JCX7_9BACT|nr:hypothetical protein X474_00030 [Dethiosulfatarculus sandiegensis]
MPFRKKAGKKTAARPFGRAAGDLAGQNLFLDNVNFQTRLTAHPLNRKKPLCFSRLSKASSKFKIALNALKYSSISYIPTSEYLQK